MSGGRGPTLADRAAASRAARGEDPPAKGAATAHGPVHDDDRLESLGRRHCWVIGPPEEPGPWPGLILEWHRGDTGWRARVMYLSELGGAQTAVQTWLEADLLRPA